MAEETEDEVTKAMIGHITADITNSFADLLIGKRIDMHLERLNFLSKYVTGVTSLIPVSSPEQQKFASLLKDVELAKEILQTHISHRESE